jgi:outer membrane protein OmpA-like peptidoglycan-associated protein
MSGKTDLTGRRTTKRRLLVALLPLCAGVLVAVGCTGPAGPAGPTGMTGMTGAQGSTGMTGVQGSTGMTGVQGSAGMTGVQGPAGITGAQGAPASSPQPGVRWTLVKEFMFDFDRSDIRFSESRKPAEVAAYYMSQNPSVRLGITGDTNRQSTDQYNLPLSQRRVATVRDALIQAGVPADRIETGTFGTDRFMCSPSTEQCSQREGRIEVLVRASS